MQIKSPIEGGFILEKLLKTIDFWVKLNIICL